MFRNRISLIPLAVYLGMGYLTGMAFSSNIFADFNQTHWHNAWTYIWLIFWPAILVVMFWLYMFIAVFAVGLIYFGYQTFIADRVLRWRQQSMRNKIRKALLKQQNRR